MPPAVAANVDVPMASPLATNNPARATPKKKKKRKNTSPPPALPSEDHIRGDGLDQWRSRAENRLKLLSEARAEAELLSTDLAAARAKASDAEHAEEVVNKGLVKAREVIGQRDRALAELTAAHTALKAENAKVVEEKRKIDKRLVILKTVSANLQEARESRDAAEKKLEDSQAVAGKLRTEVEALREQLEALAMLKQQLAKLEAELDDVTQGKEDAERTAKRNSARAAGAGAAGAVALTISMRILASMARK